MFALCLMLTPMKLRCWSMRCSDFGRSISGAQHSLRRFASPRALKHSQRAGTISERAAMKLRALIHYFKRDHGGNTMLNKGGHEIPQWRIDSNKQQIRFEGLMSGIVQALLNAGHDGWTVEHVVDPDRDYNAGLNTYYGTCTIKHMRELSASHRDEGFRICVWMSTNRGEKERKAYFSVSHGDLEKFSVDSDEDVRAGIDITKAPDRIAAEIIRRVIIPARVERDTLAARKKYDDERLCKVGMVCADLVQVTKGEMRADCDTQTMRDKNCGAELRYYVHKRVSIEGKVSHDGERVELTFDDLTPQQAKEL